jgi:dimethylargininase
MDTFTHAITRQPGPNFAQGITTSDLGYPDYDLMLEQHAAYVDALRTLGLDVIMLDAEPDYPDATFVEDVAVVTPLVAIITRPGAESRQGEENSVEPVLARRRKIVRIVPPATLDGGDVLMIGSHFFVGLSGRTNREGAGQLARILKEHGCTWTPMSVGAGLHLKSSVNYVGRNTLLVTEDFASCAELESYAKIVVGQGEEYAANTLLVNDHLMVPAGFPRTRRKLEALGLPIVELDVSEARKMDGGLTCMSIRF